MNRTKNLETDLGYQEILVLVRGLSRMEKYVAKRPSHW